MIGVGMRLISIRHKHQVSITKKKYPQMKADRKSLLDSKKPSSSTTRDDYAKELERAVGTTELSLDIATASLEALNLQHETMHRVDTTLDANDTMLDRSLRLLRGMTFGGAVMNLLMPGPANKETSPAPTHLKKDTSHSQSNSSTTAPQAATESPLYHDDEETAQLYRSVRNLRACGDAIAEKINKNNALLDQVCIKQDMALEKTYELTTQASLLHGGAARQTQPTQLIVNTLGDFEFYDATHGFFLAAQGPSLVESKEPSRNTLFTLYECPQGAFHALQNKANKKFLGISAWGYLGFYSASIERAERVLISKQNGTISLFMMASHWGRGGWLRVHPTTGKLLLTTSNDKDDREGVLVITPRRVASLGFL